MNSKAPDPEPIPKPSPAATPESPEVKAASDSERRRIAAMVGRNQTVTSQRGSILG
jgi:hypothetical protein